MSVSPDNSMKSNMMSQYTNLSPVAGKWHHASKYDANLTLSPHCKKFYGLNPHFNVPCQNGKLIINLYIGCPNNFRMFLVIRCKNLQTVVC